MDLKGLDMRILFKNITSLVRVACKNEKFKVGPSMKDVCEIEDGALIFSDKIEWVGKTQELEQKLQNQALNIDEVYDLNGKTVIPGFVDSHTHFVFAGERSNEFARRIAGATYQEIASEGGGILETVRATRKASEEELFEMALKRILKAIEYGTIALEIKSGYGLELETELKMLRVIQRLKEALSINIVSTFLGAHDFPPEYKNNRSKYIDLICEEMIPEVAKQGLATYCDCFIDKGYYTIDEGRRIFEKALEYGLKIRCHADELADVGAAKLAAEIGAISADHLLFVSDESLQAMKNSNTIATLLPGTSYFIKMPYAPAKKIYELNIPIAISTDFNPGSCFTQNMQIILSFATLNLGLTCEQALVASTLNSAAAIEMSEKVGSLEIGKDATFLVLDCKSYIDLFYNFGINHIESVWIRGSKFSSNK
ncbi:MAG: imidazolonepropionase [Ignavibacteria bacterium]|nr:imidazolonepropionase [Ignavibacteria bacterium]